MRGSSATAARTGPNSTSLDRQRLLLGVGGTILLAVAATMVAAALLARALGADAQVVWRALVAALVGGAIVLALAAKHLRAASFGAANGVTLARGALVTLLVALLGAAPSAAVGWAVVALALVGLALDGVDGRLARSRGEVSAFGARFDMETDALLILVLALLAWQLGKAGPWIVLAGALRYLFVAASVPLQWLARDLPPSRRRQAVCVVQIVTLIACVAPPIAPPVSAGIALLGLLLLVASFGADVGWLARRARG